MYRLTSRLSDVDVKQLADAIAADFTMGTAHPAFKKVPSLGPKESDPFELEELQAIAAVLDTHDFVKRHPKGYAELRAEINRILTTGR